MSNPLAVPRFNAYCLQGSRCFYCGLPTCLNNFSDFAAKHSLTVRQAKRLQCTAEHLQARKDGGADGKSNIVAACWTCNQGRHRRKNPLSPGLHKEYVQKRVRAGRWRDSRILENFMWERTNRITKSAWAA